MTGIGTRTLDLTAARTHTNLPMAALVERALANGEGTLASNGALVCKTGDRTGRSPKDKYLEDTAGIHDKIWWGSVNKPSRPSDSTKRSRWRPST
jgi:phosphoenolpyruvate carboxykinase (ATP)